MHRVLAHDYPAAVAGKGAIITDAAGKTYIDFSGGAAVSCLGHGHPRVSQAIRDQLDRIAYAHTSFFTSEPAEALAEHLIARAPEGFASVHYVSGGSEANEAALKLARQYQLELGQG
ncbi:MAG: aminotransferase class III-fold pyridoxal phosphate-dependent enzyme, partial [Rhizobiales bacterium]|nr:aminotransferase class III-fold pyridoxal phosphate-dependent enzyme [Hyphomicrobiales bacterium]